VVGFVQHKAQEAGALGEGAFQCGGRYPTDGRALVVENISDAASVTGIQGGREFVYPISKMQIAKICAKFTDPSGGLVSANGQTKQRFVSWHIYTSWLRIARAILRTMLTKPIFIAMITITGALT
jgi:hypothetical protein